MLRFLPASSACLFVIWAAPASAAGVPKYAYTTAVEVRADRMEPVRKAAIEKLLAADETKIRGCYESAAKRNPDLRLDGIFSFDRYYDNGRISSDQVVHEPGRTLVDKSVVTCVRKLANAWKVRGSGRVVIAFGFEAKESPKVKGPLKVSIDVGFAEAWGSKKVDRRWLRAADERLGKFSGWSVCKRYAGNDSRYRGYLRIQSQVDAYGIARTSASWRGIRPKRYAMIECLQKTAKQLTVNMPVTEGGVGYSFTTNIHFKRELPGKGQGVGIGVLSVGGLGAPVGNRPTVDASGAVSWTAKAGTFEITTTANVCSTLTAKIGKRRDAKRYYGAACARLGNCAKTCQRDALRRFTSLYSGKRFHEQCDAFRAAKPKLDLADRKATNEAAAAFLRKQLSREIARVERHGKRCKAKECKQALRQLASSCKPYR